MIKLIKLNKKAIPKTNQHKKQLTLYEILKPQNPSLSKQTNIAQEDIDENVKDYTMTYDFATNYTYFSKTNTSLITLDRKNYDRSIEMCMILLKKVKASYDKLNEVEKFIIKSLEFDNPPETDEELMDRLMTYKNGYYLSKKSAYIKMALQLNIKNVIKRERTDIIKQAMADACIVTISDNK